MYSFNSIVVYAIICCVSKLSCTVNDQSQFKKSLVEIFQNLGNIYEILCLFINIITMWTLYAIHYMVTVIEGAYYWMCL